MYVMLHMKCYYATHLVTTSHPTFFQRVVFLLLQVCKWLQCFFAVHVLQAFVALRRQLESFAVFQSMDPTCVVQMSVSQYSQQDSFSLPDQFLFHTMKI